MDDVARYSMDILNIKLPVEGVEIPLFGLVAGMLIIYYILRIIFQRKSD